MLKTYLVRIVAITLKFKKENSLERLILEATTEVCCLNRLSLIVNNNLNYQLFAAFK